MRELVEPEKSVVLNSWKEYARQDGGEKFVESIQILNEMVRTNSRMQRGAYMYVHTGRKREGFSSFELNRMLLIIQYSKKERPTKGLDSGEFSISI